MTLTKSFVKIYQTSGQPMRGGLLSLIRRRMKTFPSRLLNQKGMSLPEVVVSVGVMSVFMSVCCGSVTQYQTAFSSVEKSMNYSQNLHVALNFVARELGDSEIETFVDAQGGSVVFPVEFPKSALRFRLPAGTDAHGSIIYGNEVEYKLLNNQLIRTRFNSGNEPTVIANNVAYLRFGRVITKTGATLENAISVVIESKKVTRNRVSPNPAAPTGKSETVSTVIYLANYGR